MPPKHGARHGAEFTTYDPEDVKRVAWVLDRHQGPERAATEKRLALESGIEERKFRAIVADRDGIAWLIGKVHRSNAAAGGLFLARSQDEAKALTAEIASKVDTMNTRLGRRVAYAERQQASQLELFGHKGEAA